MNLQNWKYVYWNSVCMGIVQSLYQVRYRVVILKNHFIYLHFLLCRSDLVPACSQGRPCSSVSLWWIFHSELPDWSCDRTKWSRDWKIFASCSHSTCTKVFYISHSIQYRLHNIIIWITLSFGVLTFDTPAEPGSSAHLMHSLNKLLDFSRLTPSPTPSPVATNKLSFTPAQVSYSSWTCTWCWNARECIPYSGKCWWFGKLGI